MSIDNSQEVLILTGAGFTKNFGGFLAEEMWSQIFNSPHIQHSPYLRSILQDNFDFESVYSEVMDNPQVSEIDKDSLQQAILLAYKQLDEIVRAWIFNSGSRYPVNWYGFTDLLTQIHPHGRGQGYFFTLNQDLFLERRLRYHSPGTPRFPNDFYTPGNQPFKSTDFVTLHNDNLANRVLTDIKNHTGIVYIKLHGSYGWQASTGGKQLVIGKNKSSLIDAEPLLQCYMNIFKTVIAEGNKKILIIGYGFMDEHINQVLTHGIVNHGLKVFILNPQGPSQLKERMPHYAKSIFDGLSGYFPYSLLQVFPSDQSDTIELNTIKESLLKN